MYVRRGEKQAFASPGNWTKNEIVKAVAKLRLIDLILAVTVYLPVLHSRCTRHRFLVSYHSDLAVQSCALLGMTEFGNGFFCCWSLLRNNIMATSLRFTSSYDSRRFATCWC